MRSISIPVFSGINGTISRAVPATRKEIEVVYLLDFLKQTVQENMFKPGMQARTLCGTLCSLLSIATSN